MRYPRTGIVIHDHEVASWEEREWGEGEALVKQFLSEWRGAGIKVRHERRSGNHFHLEYGEVGIEVSFHGFGMGARQRWQLTINMGRNCDLRYSHRTHCFARLAREHGMRSDDVE